MKKPLLLLLLLLNVAKSDDETSGEEPPEDVEDNVLLIMVRKCALPNRHLFQGENSTHLNNNQTIYESENLLKFDLLETYLPLFIFVIDLPLKDRETLQNYLNQKTYERLKYEIDSRVKMHREDGVLSKINETLVKSINSLEQFDEVTVGLVEGYHVSGLL